MQNLPFEVSTQEITVSEGTNIATALSPDKTTLVTDLQGTLWLVPVEGGKAQPITDGLGDCRQPVWSADGQQIAFQSFRDGIFHIWTVKPDGTGLKQLTNGPYDDREPYWSSDNQTIIFSSDRSGNYDLWKINTVTGELAQLTTAPEADYAPAFSPDGQKIVFLSEREQQPGIYVLQEGKETLLYASKSEMAAPAWSPSGHEVIFQQFDQGKATLHHLTQDGQTEIISLPQEDVFPFRVNWLTDDTFLYTADGLIKKKTMGKKKAQSVPFEATLQLERHHYPRKQYDFSPATKHPVKGIRTPDVSPDGRFIVFSALSDLWVLDTAKTQPEKITSTAALDIDPDWSPDGKKLAYISDKNGSLDLWVRDMETGAEECLLKEAGALSMPVWSPDGRSIAFYQPNPKAYSRNNLNVIDIDTKKVETVYENLFASGTPSWSPDGNMLICSYVNQYSTRFREGINEFLYIPLDGSEAFFTTPHPNVPLNTRIKNGPDWSPDGKYIAYILDGLLWVVEVDAQGNFTAPPIRLTNEMAESISWTQDAQHLYYLSVDTLKRVNVSDGSTQAIPMDFTWQYQASSEPVTIYAGRIFDGKNDTYHKNMDIVVQNNRIQKIEPHKEDRSGKVIDASDKTVIPGLFEMHTHQKAELGEQVGRLWLSYGITAIREPGTDPYDALERKESWAGNYRTGPHTFITGGHMEGKRVYYNRNVSNRAGAGLTLELEKAVRLGFDMIKTYVRMPDLMQKRVTAFAHEHGIPVSSHEIYPAAAYGVDAVEHMGATSRRGYSPKLTPTNHSYQDVVSIIAKSGMVITPTISLHGGMNMLMEKDKAFFDHPQFEAFYGKAMADGLKARTSMMLQRNPDFIASFVHIQETIKKILAAGGKVTTGTDSPIIPPGLSLHAELQSWVDGGISPFETLRAATLWSAEAVGVAKDMGTVEEGKLANLVIVEGDPMKNIKDLLNVHMVLKDGQPYSLEELMQQP